VLAVLITALVAVGAGTVAVRSGEAGPPARAADATMTEVIAELRRFVESARGLPFRGPVNVSVLADADFRRTFLAGEPAEEPDLQVQEGVLRAFGLLDADDDLARASSVDPGTVAGFYDSETKELVVRGTRATPFVRQVLVHELTHALDDQHFGLDRFIVDAEAALAYEALVEGSAVAVENRYLESLPAAERRDADAEAEGTFGGMGADSRPIPGVLLELADFPYRDGAALVAALLKAGGQARLDDAYRSPPLTSADVLHPGRFLAGSRRPVAVSVAPGGRVVDGGSLGELVLRFLLSASMPAREAASAAEGWAGDQYVAWRSGRETCVRARVVMESAAEASELLAGLRRWAAGHPGATVTPAAGSSGVSLLRCA
jgi:hypothetical protein